MRKNEDKLIHKIGRGVVTGVMTTSLVLTGTPALLAATQTVALAEGETDQNANDNKTPSSDGNETSGEKGSAETGDSQGDSQETGTVASALVGKDGNLDSGKYEAAQTITVSSADELSTIANLVNTGKADFKDKTVKLTADITLAEGFTPIGAHYWNGASGKPLGEDHAFKGTFDGSGKTISGLSVGLGDAESKAVSDNWNTFQAQKTAGNNYQYNENAAVSAKGLFGYVQGGTIKDLTIASPKVAGANDQGAAVGFLDAGTIQNVTVTSPDVSGQWENSGGLVGEARGKFAIDGCSVTGGSVSIQPQEDENQNGAGGLVGRFWGDDGGKITGSTVSGVKVSAYRKAAGLAGYMFQTKSEGGATISGNKLDNVTVSVSPAARNDAGLPFNGVYIGEIQAANKVRGYEQYDGSGNVTGFTWYNHSDKSPADSPKILDGIVKDNPGATVTVREDFSQAQVADIDDQQYTGSEIKPGVKVTIDGKDVDPDVYDVAYEANTGIGTAKVTVTAKGTSIYSGSVSKTFDITDKAGLEKLGTAVQNSRTIDSQIDKRRFSAGTVKAYEDAIASAERVQSNKFSSQDEIQKALDDLNDAYGKLTPAQGVSMYRLYNPNSGEHFYTGSKAEHDHLVDVGWSDEGTGWVAPASSNTPVYRLYNPNAGDHHYTTDASERDTLIEAGWNYEGIGWFSDDAREVPLYRQYNPNAQAGSHNFTTSREENDHLVSLGWRAEGIGWYGIKADAAK